MCLFGLHTCLLENTTFINWHPKEGNSILTSWVYLETTRKGVTSHDHYLIGCNKNRKHQQSIHQKKHSNGIKQNGTKSMNIIKHHKTTHVFLHTVKHHKTVGTPHLHIISYWKRPNNHEVCSATQRFGMDCTEDHRWAFSQADRCTDALYECGIRTCLNICSKT